jgi:hypothetical protein
MMKKGKSLFLLFSLLCSLFYSLNADERDNIETNQDSQVETQGASSLSFSDTGISSSSSSLLESTREASDNFLCRVCGNTLFSRDQHIHGPILTGPRIVSVKNEPELGELGSLHDISRSNVNGFVSTALFDPSLPNGVAVGVMSDSSTFAGYNQRQILCGRCGQPIGWRFDSQTSVFASGPAMTGGKASLDNSGSISSATINKGVGSPSSPSTPSSSTSSSSSLESDPYVGIPRIVAPYSVSEEELRLSSLLNINCLQLSRGYWSFEFCHKVRINQYHAEANGAKDPVWSLGEYDTSGKVERTRPLSSASGYYTSHFYTGGQLCHETNKGRSSEVQFFCCPHLAVPSLEEVEEPSICRYRIRVCVPSVCIPDPVAVAALAAAQSSSITDRSSASVDSSIQPSSSSLTDSSHGGDDFLNENNNEDDLSNNDRSSLSSSSAASITETVDPSTSHSSTLSTSSTTIDGKSPLYGPGSIFDPKNVPASFIAAAWHTILGDKGDTMKELEEGELSTGIAQVRF